MKLLTFPRKSYLNVHLKGCATILKYETALKIQYIQFIYVLIRDLKISFVLWNSFFFSQNEDSSFGNDIYSQNHIKQIILLMSHYKAICPFLLECFMQNLKHLGIPSPTVGSWSDQHSRILLYICTCSISSMWLYHN